MTDCVKNLLEALDKIKEVTIIHMLGNSFRELQWICEAGLPFPKTLLTFQHYVMYPPIISFIRVVNNQLIWASVFVPIRMDLFMFFKLALYLTLWNPQVSRKLRYKVTKSNEYFSSLNIDLLKFLMVATKFLPFNTIWNPTVLKLDFLMSP